MDTQYVALSVDVGRVKFRTFSKTMKMGFVTVYITGSHILHEPYFFLFARLSPKPRPQLGAVVVIFQVNPTTHPNKFKLASDKVTAYNSF